MRCLGGLARWPLWCSVGSLLLCLVPEAVAQRDVADARGRLGRIQGAAGTLTYQGTVAFSSGGAVSSSRVLHISDGKQRFERTEILDGQSRQQYRHNDQVHTVWPRDRVAVIEQQDPVADFPALPVSDGRLLDHYDIRTIGSDRVAGHEAEVLLLKPRDSLRYAQRLWSEKTSGLLLRNDILGPGGEVLESSAFTDLAIGGKAHPDAVLGPMRKLDGYRVVRPVVAHTQLEAEGWSLSRPVPGFVPISCVRRPLDATAQSGASPPVLQAVFSDGLTHVSLFIEPFDAQRHKPVRTSLGATQTLMNRSGDWWITVMGDVPMATVQLFAAGLERKR